MNSRGKVDTQVILLGFLFIAGLAGLIYSDEILSFSGNGKVKKSGKNIGNIQSVVSDVRRRAVVDLVWDKANNQDAVYEGDTIFTGENSETTIALQSGGELNLGSNSLVVVTTTSGEMSLDVQYGTLTGTLGANQKLKLKLNGQETEIAGGNSSAKLKIRADGKVAVIEGAAKVDGKEVNKNEKLDLNSGKTERLTDAELMSRVQLVDPADSAVMMVAPGKNVNFRWRAPVESNDLFVEVAKELTFMRPIWRSIPGKNQMAATSAISQAGPVYWRIKSSKSQAATQPRRLGLFVNEPVKLLAPKVDEEFAIPEAQGTQRPIRFRWQDRAPASRYHLEVSTDSEFKNLVVQGSVKSVATESQPLLAGEYFWRVRPEHAQRPPVTWSVGKFKIVAEALVKPPAPVIASKVLDVELEAEVRDMQAFAALPKNDQRKSLAENIKNPVVLRWNKVAGIKQYEVQITRLDDKEFKQPVVDENVSRTEFKWTKSLPGKFLWRVLSKKPSGVTSDGDSIGQINVQVAPPKNFATEPIIERIPSSDSLSQPLNEVQMKWQDVVYAEKYEVEIAKNLKFNQKQKKIASNPEVAVIPPQLGDSYYRVRPLNSKAQPLGPFSAPQILNYQRNIELDVPEILRPQDGSTSVFVGQGERPVILNWEPVSGAVVYQYQLARDANFKDLISDEQTSTNRALIADNLGIGEYYWRVMAKSSDGTIKSRWHTPARFSITTITQRAPAKSE